MPIAKAQLKEFRQLLLTVRRRIVGEIQSIVEDAAKSPRDASGDLSGYTVHMADMAADTYEREMSVRRRSPAKTSEGRVGVVRVCTRVPAPRSYPVTQPSGSSTGDGGDEPSRGTR